MIEDVVRQIRTRLQQGLPQKLDAIELERGDGVVLDDVRSFLIQRTSVGQNRPRYPSLSILGEFTAGSNALSRRRELRHKISIWVSHRVVGPDTELLQIKLWRYVEAVERLLGADPTLGGKVIDSVITSHDFLDSAPGSGGFVAEAKVVLDVLERPSAEAY